MKKDKTEYDNFSDALKKVLSVPRAKMVEMLAQEKASKKAKKRHKQLADALKESVESLETKKKPRRIAKG